MAYNSRNTIDQMLGLIGCYVAFTRPEGTEHRAAVEWPEGYVPGYETYSGLVTKLREVFDDTGPTPFYRGVEVMFHDGDALLVAPDQAWRWEVWGETHQEAMEMLAQVDGTNS